MGAQMHEQILRDYEGLVLPPGHPASRLVNKVLERLVGALGEGNQGAGEWEAVVIDDEAMVNAFVVPG